MSELRQDALTREWVIYSPERGKRPSQFKHETGRDESLPERDGQCPFCPGNEHMLPAIEEEFGLEKKNSWQIRIVPNKYPALLENEPFLRKSRGVYNLAGGYGRHEVIVESPLHNADIPEMSLEQLSLLVDVYHSRYSRLLSSSRIRMVTVFRNHGYKAGTSLIHPHSQIIAGPIIPSYVRMREMEAQRHFDDRGRCIFCGIIDFERKEKERVILENGSFLCFVPFAAAVPFEIWIMPKQHRSNFSSVSKIERYDLASAVHSLLTAVRRKLGDIDYNYVIHSFSRNKTDEPHLHWFFRIQPRLTTKAGFEIGSGIRINPLMPEENAAFLREGLS